MEERRARHEDIGTVFRFGDGPAAHDAGIFTFHKGGDEFIYQMLIGHHAGVKSRKTTASQRHGETGAPIGQFFEKDMHGQGIQTHAAVRIGNQYGMVFVLVHLLHALPVKRIFFYHFLRR